MRRVICLELEVFGARAPVCKAECVQIMNGFDDLVAFMSIQRLNMQTFHQRNIFFYPKRIGKIGKIGNVHKRDLLTTPINGGATIPNVALILSAEFS